MASLAQIKNGTSRGKSTTKSWKAVSLCLVFITIASLALSLVPFSSFQSNSDDARLSTVMPPSLGSKDDDIDSSSSTVLQCEDRLPLLGGHFHWDESRQEAIRLHTENTEICGPKVLIIGAMKCGTNTLGQLLSKHPRVKVNRCKAGKPGCNVTAFQGGLPPSNSIWEGHDFTHKRFEPCCHFPWHIANLTNNLLSPVETSEWLGNFSRRLPWTDGIHYIAMDKSPSYIDTAQFPNVAKIAKQYLPNAKIVLSVCNPALRLYSEFYHNSEKIPEEFHKFYQQHNVTPPATFAEFTNLLLDSNHSICKEQTGTFCQEHRILFLKKGEYASHLKKWYRAYGKSNVLVVNMKDNQTNIAQNLLKLVGSDILPVNEYPWEELSEQNIKFKNTAYEGRSTAYKKFPLVMEKLENYYNLHNNELAQMLDAEFPLFWNLGSTEF